MRYFKVHWYIFSDFYSFEFCAEAKFENLEYLDEFMTKILKFIIVENLVKIFDCRFTGAFITL